MRPHLRRSRRALLVALLAGIAVALIGYLSDHSSSGTGYTEATLMIGGEGDVDPLYKMAATLASYLSGIPGGIFGPSLATGAGIGADLGHWLPVAPVSVMILLVMAGYFSCVVQTPITAFIIVMEITGSQELLLALMATSFIAYGTSLLVCPKPLYDTLAEAFLPPDKGR